MKNTWPNTPTSKRNNRKMRKQSNKIKKKAND